jgi:hypothetical protein
LKETVISGVVITAHVKAVEQDTVKVYSLDKEFKPS